MKTTGKTQLVLGIDYGTDSCRAIVIGAADGSELAQAVAPYPRWSKGLYCSPQENRFRQHPRDYIESLEAAMKSLEEKLGPTVLSGVAGIGIDTTGSTPCAVDAFGTPLSLKPEFAEDPDAMFILWKDHTATREAENINALAKSWGGEDFTKYEGGVYSSEWFWAKALHVMRKDGPAARAAASFLEHCDWMPALLSGTPLSGIKRSRCAAGHKAMWHADFGGYPAFEFFNRLSPALGRILPSLGKDTFTSDQSFGRLTREWAGRLGLPEGIPIAVGALDAHMGAVGSGARPGVLVKVMGTSTCDMLVGPRVEARTGTPTQAPTGADRLVAGICGQVDGSIMPGMLGYEAGQSAFGDVYAWFKKLLMWPLESVLPKAEDIDSRVATAVTEAMDAAIMTVLEAEASAVDPASSSLLALDWLNGRRTPDANQLLKGAITGLSLGTTAPALYRALIEATAFGAKAIVERFRREGVKVERIAAIGGVARKSPLVMQIVADVLDSPIDIVASDQCVALGAAMFASVVAGFHASAGEAQAAMAPRIERTVAPDPKHASVYKDIYTRYLALGAFVEQAT
ncbi:MAG: ribulokinase [Spirochaetes bacterium]|nr:ribulokinase [Spirochaetota bacterium]